MTMQNNIEGNFISIPDFRIANSEPYFFVFDSLLI